MRSRVNVCGNVCVDMANAISIASVGYPCTCSCPWWRWSSSKAFRKHWSKQLGILPTCITTTFGRSGSRRSRRQNLNWTTSRSRSAGMNYERDGETVTDDFELWSLTENSRWATTNFSSRGRHSVEFFFFCGRAKPMDSVEVVAAPYGPASVWNSAQTYSWYGYFVWESARNVWVVSHVT